MDGPSNGTVPSVLVVCAGQRDRLNLADERILDRFALRFAGQPMGPGFDPRTFVDHMVRFGPAADGIFGSSDATGHLATILADAAGLPGPGRAAFMRCHDKLACRHVQADVVPEATPRFAPVSLDDPGVRPPLPFPFFLKPVAAHLSQLAFTVADEAQFAAAVARARLEIDAVTAYDRALEGRGFRTLIAEELLDGTLVTFEGWMQGGRMTPIGVTDAVMHANSISFLRFEYPSRLPEGPRRTMADVAARLMPALGFDQSLFNIEFFVRPDGSVTIVEVNGRMASQFAPLVQAVHGVSSYEIQLELCAGGTPQLPPARHDLVTASFLLRSYDDAVVRSVPDPTTVLERFPHAHVEVLVRPGHRLSENDDDTVSHRLAVVALAAGDRPALLQRFAEAVTMLPFELEPLSAPVG
ncbi:MAG TPA: ATP-grasp domain-containing protein [Gaiellales bacterium]